MAFRPRLSRRRNGFGVSFSPAVSGKALKSIRQTVRHWILHERSDKTLDDLARMFNNHIRGWINYYGRFYKSALYPTLRTSTASWHDGRIGSSSPSDATSDGHITGCSASCGVSPICLLTGDFCMDAAEQWEPDEARASRPVLRARGGEIPPRDSPVTFTFAANARVSG